jgi:serine/threonine protein kinase
MGHDLWSDGRATGDVVSGAQDPERLAGFEREAKVLASLNHPNITQIYGIETADGGLRGNHSHCR